MEGLSRRVGDKWTEELDLGIVDGKWWMGRSLNVCVGPVWTTGRTVVAVELLTLLQH